MRQELTFLSITELDHRCNRVFLIDSKSFTVRAVSMTIHIMLTKCLSIFSCDWKLTDQLKKKILWTDKKRHLSTYKVSFMLFVRQKISIYSKHKILIYASLIIRAIFTFVALSSKKQYSIITNSIKQTRRRLRVSNAESLNYFVIALSLYFTIIIV